MGLSWGFNNIKCSPQSNLDITGWLVLIPPPTNHIKTLDGLNEVNILPTAKTTRLISIESQPKKIVVVVVVVFVVFFVVGLVVLVVVANVGHRKPIFKVWSNNKWYVVVVIDVVVVDPET